MNPYEPCMCGAPDCPTCGRMQGTYCEVHKIDYAVCGCDVKHPVDFDPGGVGDGYEDEEMPDNFDPRWHR